MRNSNLNIAFVANADRADRTNVAGAMVERTSASTLAPSKQHPQHPGHLRPQFSCGMPAVMPTQLGLMKWCLRYFGGTGRQFRFATLGIVSG